MPAPSLSPSLSPTRPSWLQARGKAFLSGGRGVVGPARLAPPRHAAVQMKISAAAQATGAAGDDEARPQRRAKVVRAARLAAAGLGILACGPAMAASRDAALAERASMRTHTVNARAVAPLASVSYNPTLKRFRPVSDNTDILKLGMALHPPGWSQKAVYVLDRTLEQHPQLYIVMLVGITIAWVLLGGIMWFVTTLISKVTKSYDFELTSFKDCVFKAWCCLASSSYHTKEPTYLNRGMAMSLFFGGIVTYSLMTWREKGTVSAQMKNRLERIRHGHQSVVYEKDHVIIVGANTHLVPVLEQLSRARSFDMSAKPSWGGGRQTVLLLSDANSGQDVEAIQEWLRSLRLPHLDLLCRKGMLTDPVAYHATAAPHASKVIVLGKDDDPYNADALAMSSTTANLLEDWRDEHSANSSEWISPVEDLSAKMLVQCARQPGLEYVYKALMKHTGEVFNIRHYPQLEGLPYKRVRRHIEDGLVAAVVDSSRNVQFHPAPGYKLKASDRLAIVAAKHTLYSPPRQLVEEAAAIRAGGAAAEAVNEAIEREDERLKAIPDRRLMDMASEFRSQLHARRNAVMSALKEGRESGSTYRLDWLRFHWQKDSIAGRASRAGEKILMLGWRDGCADMLMEFDLYVGPGTEVVVLSQVPVEQREALLHKKLMKLPHMDAYDAAVAKSREEDDFVSPVARDVDILQGIDEQAKEIVENHKHKGKAGLVGKLNNITVKHVVGSPLSRTDVNKALFGGILNSHKDLITGKEYEAVVESWQDMAVMVCRGNDEKDGQSGQADRTTVFSSLLCLNCLKDHGITAQSLVAELEDKALGRNLKKTSPIIEPISSTNLMGLYTSAVVEHAELNQVWSQLLQARGSEIYIKDAGLYTTIGVQTSFRNMQEVAAERGEVAIGYRRNGRVELCPSRGAPITLGEGDGLVVISIDQT